MQKEIKRPKKFFGRYKKPLVKFPNLIEAQVKSFKWLVEEGIGEVFKEFSPIIDYSGKKFQLEFTSFSLSESKNLRDRELFNGAFLRASSSCLVGLVLGRENRPVHFCTPLPMEWRTENGF